VIGLLATPPGLTLASCRGLVITCPGAGGGPGPTDPCGGGGGGTYGGYNVFGNLASELAKHGIAVLLMHYPADEPGRPLEGGIAKTAEHATALLDWAISQYGSPQMPVALVGWSMGGAVAINTGASAVRSCEASMRGVATIASMKEVAEGAPKTLVDAQVPLLLMHNVAGRCTGANSIKIAQSTGRKVEPLLFPGEDHGVKSAFCQLLSWLPPLFNS